MIDILGIDLGTSTGWAYNRGDEFFCGVWTLGTAKEIRQWGKERLTRNNDPRVERLCTHITALGHFDVVAFEDVEFSTYTRQTQLWASLRASVWLCANSAFIGSVAVGSLKKFATGAGNADKSQMSAALKNQHPMIWTPELNDDEVDAIWIHCWAKHTFSRMFKQ